MYCPYLEGQINQIWANQKNVPMAQVEDGISKYDMSRRLKAALSHAAISLEKDFYCVCIIYKHKYHQSWSLIIKK
jgi:hypothetical protein